MKALEARVIAEYGPTATIVSITPVTSGGLWGFFAKRHYEATVDVPDHGDEQQRPGPPIWGGIGRLLDGADRVEALSFADDVPILSTSSVDFDSIMAELSYQTAVPVPAPDRPTVSPRPPLLGPGDLVALVGLGDDPVDVTRSMAKASGLRSVAVAGVAGGHGLPRLSDRRGVLAARAAAVGREQSLLVALGLPRSGLDGEGVLTLRHLEPDQVWVVVDAGRKPEDTARWVRAVQAVVPIDAVALIATESTATPRTVHDLGLQVGWTDELSIG